MLESLQYRSSNGREIVYADVITPPEGMVPQGIVQIIHGMLNISDGIMNLCGIWQNMDL